MMRPTIPIEEFDTEKKVILEEIAMYNDRPDFIIFDEVTRSAKASWEQRNPSVEWNATK